MDLNDPVFINPKRNVDMEQMRSGLMSFIMHSEWLRTKAGRLLCRLQWHRTLAKSYNDAYVYDGQFSDHRKKYIR